MTDYSDFDTPIEWEPQCPCGEAIRLRGPAGAKCKGGHTARLSLGPTARLEWGHPGAWRYVSQFDWPEDDRDREWRELRQFGTRKGQNI